MAVPAPIPRQLAPRPTARSRRVPQRAPAGRRGLVLAVVLLAALAINLDTTIVNVALPTLNVRLGSSTTGLQWVVDGYNLAFAALVLAGGNLGDRYGRRGALAVGLALFAVTSLAAALCTSTGTLVAARFGMGAAAAVIYPTTLSVITNTFAERDKRAAAIGAWGAVSGLGVAVGPILGGALLQEFWWGSIFLALIPVALLALAGTWLAVPASRDTARPPLDRAGLGLSVLLLGSLVYTIIEAPGAGWLTAPTLGGFAVAAVALAGFVAVERRHVFPLLDVRLFTNPRFSAASAAVTFAFFALFGFIFLITQFMQQLQGHGPLGTGVRILPVAFSIAAGSVLGSRLAVARFGTKTVVAGGLLSLTAAFAWIGTISPSVPYPVIACQMVLLGGGLGLTSAPATESIMGAVRPEQAGAGSAVNDATRQVGGTLGVAVLGSIFASLYSQHLQRTGRLAGVPADLLEHARSSLGQGLAVAAHTPPPLGAPLHDAVAAGFLSGLHAGGLTAAAVCAIGAAVVGLLLPNRPTKTLSPESTAR